MIGAGLTRIGTEAETEAEAAEERLSSVAVACRIGGGLRGE